MLQPRIRIEDTPDGISVVAFPDGMMLDTATVQAIGDQLYQIVERDAKKKIVLDFTHIRFMSSQALGVLLTLQRRAQKQSARIVISNLRKELFRVFQITNLDKMLQFSDNTSDAIVALGGTPPARDA